MLRVIPIRRLYHRNFECNDYLPYRVIIDPRFTTEIGDCSDQYRGSSRFTLTLEDIRGLIQFAPFCEIMGWAVAMAIVFS